MEKSTSISREMLEIALLEALIEIGGKENLHNIYPLVTKKFPERESKSGKDKWEKRIRWTAVALRLSKDMHSADGLPRGIWAITDKGRDRVSAKKARPPTPPSLSEEIGKLTSVAKRLSTFQAIWVTFESFKDHVDEMKNYFSKYEEIWITGHFSYSFARGLEGLCKKFPGCDLRILSIDPKGNKNNLRALNKLKADGAKVKIHPALHARIFIVYNESTSSWETIIGSYDYNREGISGENINASVASLDISVVQDARTFFLSLWDSPEAYEDF